MGTVPAPVSMTGTLEVRTTAWMSPAPPRGMSTSMGPRASIMLITGRPWTNLKVGSELYAEVRRMLGKLAQDAALQGQRGIVKMGFGRAL